MPLGIGSGLWAVIAPIDAFNIHQNPSFEFGTTGVSAIQAATLGSTSQFQRFGAWSLKVTPSSNGTSGAMLGTYTTGAGTTYSVSVWAFVEQGVPMRLGVGDQNGVNLQSSSTITFTGGGTWQWYASIGLAEAGVNTRSVVLQKSSGNSQLSYYVDGVMVNPWTDSIDRVTTYFDGDTGGGTWLGAQHASPSTRTGQYRGGGSIIALADLGLSVDQALGVGMPPIENSSQSYAITDGAQFQRQRGASRHFTLTAKPIVGTSLADFHVTRRALIDVIKPDLVVPQQPIHFLYYGGQGTIGSDAYYEKGLELGNMDGPIAENAAISFVAYDPYWYAQTQQGTTLAPRVALGSVNFIARRSPQGQWGTLGANGSTFFNPASGPITVWDILQNSGGTVFVGGNWGTLAGTVAPGIGMYYPTTNTFGTLAGGTVDKDNSVVALAQNPGGTLFLGGNFTTVGGTAAKSVARWTGAFGTLQGGSLTGPLVWDLLYSPNGTLFIGGQFTNIQGTANSRNIAMWSGAFGSLGGTVGLAATTGNIQALAWGLDNRLLFTGVFTNSNGTVGTAVGFWKGGAFGTMGGVGDGNGAWGFALGVGPNGVLYEGGAFTYTSGGSALHAAAWNGVQHQTLGLGVGGDVWSVVPDLTTGDILYGGAFTSAGSINSAANYARWNGAAWVPPDILFVGAPGYAAGTVRTIYLATDRSLYIGGDFSGTTSAAAVGTIVNSGRAQVYPQLRLRNQGAGTARIFQMINTTTNTALYFNYVMQSSEQALLVLAPGQRSFQSNLQGNVFGAIMPSSNLANWSLLPGTNYVSFFSDSGSVEASFFWQPRGWSIDSGTMF